MANDDLNIPTVANTDAVGNVLTGAGGGLAALALEKCLEILLGGREREAQVG